MFVFEWVFGWFGSGGATPPFTKPGVVVRTNRGNPVVRTQAKKPIMRGR